MSFKTAQGPEVTWVVLDSPPVPTQRATRVKRKVGLAEAVDINVLHDYYLTVIDGEQGIMKDFVDVRRIPAG